MQTVPVVAIVGKVLLRTQQQQLAVEHEEAAIVTHAAVHDRQSNVAHEAVRKAAAQQLLHTWLTSSLWLLMRLRGCCTNDGSRNAGRQEPSAQRTSRPTGAASATELCEATALHNHAARLPWHEAGLQCDVVQTGRFRFPAHRYALPRVFDGVLLQKVILAAVARNLQLRPYLHSGTSGSSTAQEASERHGSADGRRTRMLTLYRAPLSRA